MGCKKSTIIMTALFLGIMIGAMTARAEAARYVHTESFAQDHSMSGLFSHCTEYFTVERWDIETADFVMVYSASSLRDERLSDVTVSLNGESFYSKRLTGKSEDRKTLKISIPVRLLKEGVNELRIESYIRTSESIPCVDDVSKSNWIHIAKDSMVSILYTPEARSNGISELYQEVTSIYALENRKSALIVPDQANDTELTLAAAILTGVSKNANKAYQNLRLVKESQVFEKDRGSDLEYGIYAGELSSLPELLIASLSEEAKKAAQNGAVVVFSRVGRLKLLIVTGTNRELLLKAGAMFGNAGYMGQMAGEIHKVLETEQPKMEKTAPLEYLKLTEDGAYVEGAFRQSSVFSLSSYANQRVSSSSEIYLKIRYSKNLDFDRSLATVYINDIPIGSHKLSAKKADDDEMELYVPSDLDISGDFTIKVAFDLEQKDLWCTLRQGETPWAYVSPESRMKIVLAEEVPLTFQHYPAPFLKSKSLNNILIALPSQPTLADLLALQGICLTLGRFQENNRGSILVRQGAKEQDCRGKNVIVIGTYSSNSFVRENNSKLYFQYSEDGTRLVSNEKMPITEEAGARMGSLQLIPSPYGGENQAMLFLTGATEEGMLSAAKYLSDTELLWKAAGDGCAVLEEEIYPFRFVNEEQTMLETAEELLEREDVADFLIVCLAVFGVLILGLIFMVIKYGRDRKKNRKGRKSSSIREGDEL